MSRAPDRSRSPVKAERRPYGAGSLLVRRDVTGRESWYGQWWAGNRRVKRLLGLKRPRGTREGLTRAQAERELHRRMDTERTTIAAGRSITVEEAGRLLLERLVAMGRKRSTVEGYESALRVHLVPHFGSRALARISPADVDAFIARRSALAPKSVQNFVGFLHSIFEFAIDRGWVTSNPCKRVRRPRQAEVDADIRFLDEAELDALLDACEDTTMGRLDRALFLTAAMSGLRQGELLALRWRDIDWSAGRIRVRRNFVRGEYGTPKSRRSTRSVPLANRARRGLELYAKSSAYDGDDDLVFCHPQSGRPLDRSKLLKRFKSALRRAGVRELRFHDLRHTFGTRCAAAGVPLRTIQEWLGHRDFKTTLIYADYAPSQHEAEMIERAFKGQAC